MCTYNQDLVECLNRSTCILFNGRSVNKIYLRDEAKYPERLWKV